MNAELDHSVESNISPAKIDIRLSSSSDISVDVNSFGRTYQDLGDNRFYHANSSDEHGCDSNEHTGIDSNGNQIDSSYATYGVNFNLSDEKNGFDIFDPPEAEDSDGDMELNVSNNIDENEDRFEVEKFWGQPSMLSSFEREGSGSLKIREVKQRAMKEVLYEKFKTIVHELLRTYGITSSGEDSENWTDIITSLSLEAACFIKLDPSDSKAMDPDGYVKVKCVATGSRSQSQLIKGLVFKKNASHKHMPTKHANPKLILIHGALDQSLSKLSSFDSIKQEESHIQSVINKLALYRPNVILVEKSAARFVQELLLAKGITLIVDMKLYRLQRIARCTSSPIVSPNDVQNQALKHCESFHLEKFIEEHAIFGDSGKKPVKTLMFLEGFPTRFGCTILLKGASNDELKRIKSVVKYSVVMAYHLILETAFLVDQRVMFSSISFPESPERNLPFIVKDIPITAGSDKEQPCSIISGLEQDTTFSFEPYNPSILTGLSSISASVRKEVEDIFPLAPHLGTTKSEEDSEIPIANSYISLQNAPEKCNGGEVSGNISADFVVSSETNVDHINYTDVQIEHRNSTFLDTEDLLIMMSIRNASKGTVCEEVHYTRIKFYKDLDVPLGKFFQERIFNQSSTCGACSDLAGAHFHYYTYRNKQLTVRVKQLPDSKCLPGERGGKLWMWSRCGKCYGTGDISKCTYRVPVSAAAQNLSFGKFLELSFSQYSTSSASGQCGHHLPRDFFHFFGIGKMVAMFSFSEIATYSVVKPPQKLVFSKSVKREKLEDETEKVRTKGMLFFTEIENHLHKMAYALKCLHLCDSVEEFADVEKLFMDEKNEFVENIQRLYDDSPYQSVQIFLKLNLLQWKLLLESCIWEKRLHDLLSVNHATIGTKTIEQILPDELDGVKKKELNQMPLPDDELSVTETPIEPNGSSDGRLAQLSNQEIDSSLAEVSADNTESACHLMEIPLLSGDSSVDRNIKNAPENKARGSNSVPNVEFHAASGSSKQWIWKPFPDLMGEFINDLLAGHLPLFEPIYSSTLELMPTIHQLIMDEGKKLHIPLCKDMVLTDHEGELSSIIACALALLKDHCIPVDHVGQNRKQKLIPTNDSSQHPSLMGSFTSSPWYSGSSLRSDGSHFSSHSLDESRMSSFHGQDLLDSLLPLEEDRLEITLGPTNWKNKYSVVCLYAGRFRDLRNICIPSEHDYISSLSRCTNWNAKGGKSRAVFAKTLDDRFIIKEIKKTEFDSFVKFAPEYFKYMTESFDLKNPTCLAKIVGIYQVTIRQSKGVKEVKHDLVVMENLTFGHNISKQYDLKGALHDRFNSGSDNCGEVFLDQNFVNDMGSSPLYISRTEKHRLERALWNDTVFLNSIGVMDYSLLVGIDAEKKELVCGIIDYLRQYTWEKQLETWYKSSLLVPKNVKPTVISPSDYKKRFRKFMAAYLLWIPDEWCSQDDSNSVGAFASKVKHEPLVKVKDSFA